MAKTKDKTATSHLDKAPRTTKRPGAGSVYDLSARENETQERTREPLVRFGPQTKKKKA